METDLGTIFTESDNGINISIYFFPYFIYTTSPISPPPPPHRVLIPQLRAIEYTRLRIYQKGIAWKLFKS